MSKKLTRLVRYVKVTVKWHNSEIMLGLQFICQNIFHILCLQNADSIPKGGILLSTLRTLRRKQKVFKKQISRGTKNQDNYTLIKKKTLPHPSFFYIKKQNLREELMNLSRSRMQNGALKYSLTPFQNNSETEW